MVIVAVVGVDDGGVVVFVVAGAVSVVVVSLVDVVDSASVVVVSGTVVSMVGDVVVSIVPGVGSLIACHTRNPPTNRTATRIVTEVPNRVTASCQ